ncbi:RING finger protein [Paramyrothecium foliicola]|nr:RING finger protein [Paramyrothecium foliicola]
MSSLVSDFFINPVLRQARRLSELSRTTFSGDVGELPQRQDAAAVSDHDHADESVDDSSLISPESPRSRPPSSLTGDVAFDQDARTPLAEETTAPDRLGFPVSPKKHRRIPEDDGMQELRSQIHLINARDIPSVEKARLIHEALLVGYRASIAATLSNVGHANDGEVIGPINEVSEHSAAAGPLESLKFWQNQLGEASATEKFNLSETDIAPTYAPIRQPKAPSTPGTELPPSSLSTPSDTPRPLGCQHYERNVKLQCFTCSKWYTCRFCHDAQEDHALIRRETRNMLCMLCATPQKASDICVNCGEIAAQYYCNICKLWENRSSKPIYHCNDCGICRRGRGLGKDFFHCKKCRACITTSIESSHKCIERSTDCDCPICGDYMFTSPKPVVFMACGHSIHKKCYDQHMRVSYKCPICNKSLANMETQFRNLDVAIQSQPMPPEFRDTTASILCNDCSGKSTVSYHWLGLKCSICRSYNTVELQIFGGDELQRQLAATEASAANSQVLSPDQAREISATVPVASQPNGVANRRRHSSHAPEFQYSAPDRIARSLSPVGMDPLAAQLANEPDTDSEDDQFGFWGSVRHHYGDAGGDDSSYEDSESNDESGGDEDIDDDDEEEEIVLIGHR